MKRVVLSVLFLTLVFGANKSRAYDHFKTAVYCTARDVQNLSDENYFRQSLDVLRRSMHIDKVYLEVHRGTTNDLQTMLKVKRLFEREGIETAGGITATLRKTNSIRFGVLCYSDSSETDRLFKAVKIAARAFDAFILDDFFFTSCRGDGSIKAKGTRSWSDFRLRMMTDVSRRLVRLAKATNPRVKVVIKYPNWYAFYQNTGYNLATQPQIFDGIYTGTETRDRIYTHQNLQPYQSYSLMRYLENAAPGKNGGGWVDPLARRTLDRYAQQLMLTILGGAREVTLFHWGGLLKTLPSGKMMSEMAPVAGSTFRLAEAFAGMTKRPRGLFVYRPLNSSGEDFLTSYLGMLGIPLELTPRFPQQAPAVLLTAAAAHDEKIVSEIRSFLARGGNVIVTSGLLQQLRGKGIEEFTSARTAGYVTIGRSSDLNFNDVFDLRRPVTVPRIIAPTNDAWAEVLGLSAGGNAFPLLTRNIYSKGQIMVLTVPDDFSDLYALPRETLIALKQYLLGDLPFVADAPPEVSLFLYANGVLVIQSFLPHNTTVRLLFKESVGLKDVLHGTPLKGIVERKQTVFTLKLDANQMRVLRFNRQ